GGRLSGDEDPVPEPAGVAEAARDPPGRVARDLDPRFALELANLPLGATAILVDREVGRQAEVALATGREANVGADARDAEGPDVLARDVLADHVPGAVVVQERIGIHRPVRDL